MYMILDNKSSTDEIQKIIKLLEENKLGANYILDAGVKKIGIIGDKNRIPKEKLMETGIVQGFHTITKPYKFASREFKKEDTIIEINGVKIGGGNYGLMAGPCSIENREMILEIAKSAKESGAQYLRGGAFKPRTSPYDFQGLGEEGLKYMREAGDKYGLLVVTEVMDSKDIEVVAKYADILQVGARNMQNFSLLKELGSCGKPILLKRGMSATIREFLMAGEYLIAFGNKEVILCERGIRTFETMTRNTVDINGIALIKEKSHLPIIIDASHGTGRKSLVEPITFAGIIAGADGAMVEIHNNPACALSDGEQSLNLEEFKLFSKKFKKLIELKKELV
ncbi:3-deoxy-7-phosphoheptulonate synthase [Cetobacterium sp. SF1]|uniref:3-deoxy-7-phosphoheptulonate synthase n=1 Tax=unclassified Cetobacterium TaxID=2630983 RepID=UPI003CF58A57